MLEAICNDISPQKRNNWITNWNLARASSGWDLSNPMIHLGTRTAMSGRFRCSKTLGSAPRTWFRTTGSRRSPPSGWWQVKGTLIEWLNWGYVWVASFFVLSFGNWTKLRKITFLCRQIYKWTIFHSNVRLLNFQVRYGTSLWHVVTHIFHVFEPRDGHPQLTCQQWIDLMVMAVPQLANIFSRGHHMDMGQNLRDEGIPIQFLFDDWVDPSEEGLPMAIQRHFGALGLPFDAKEPEVRRGTQKPRTQWEHVGTKCCWCLWMCLDVFVLSIDVYGLS
jgi:hypothetical protein